MNKPFGICKLLATDVVESLSKRSEYLIRESNELFLFIGYAFIWESIGENIDMAFNGICWSVLQLVIVII